LRVKPTPDIQTSENNKPLQMKAPNNSQLTAKECVKLQEQNQ
jgi:hypothetical protein